MDYKEAFFDLVNTVFENAAKEDWITLITTTLSALEEIDDPEGIVTFVAELIKKEEILGDVIDWGVDLLKKKALEGMKVAKELQEELEKKTRGPEREGEKTGA